jgi:hypothetical protein
MAKIQIIREIEQQDKAVVRAMEISKNFKVLPYNEVTKRLDLIASDYHLARASK